MNTEAITVTVKNWDESRYKPRKDVDFPSWYKCSNRLLEDADFYKFRAEERLVWYRILELISQKQSKTVEIDLEHTESVCRIKRKFVQSAIQKLENKGFLVVGTLRERNVDVTCALPERKKERKKEGGSKKTEAKVPAAPVQESANQRNPILDFEAAFTKDRTKYEKCFAYFFERAANPKLSTFATSHRIRESMAVFETPEECWEFLESLADRIFEKSIDDPTSYAAASWRNEVDGRKTIPHASRIAEAQS